MQDRAQKSAALRYVVAKRWFPQIELDVATHITIAKTPTTITDVDVYASVPDDFLGFRTVLFDCKTRRGESPITRAMWQRGLMERLNADRGVCILRARRIEVDHRYTAAQFGVTLLAESEFPAYAAATAPDMQFGLGAIADIDRWDAYFDIPKRFARLEAAIKFSRSGFWMSENEAEACTRTIFLAFSVRPELDPDRPEHIAIVADLTALFTHALAIIVARIFAAYLQPHEQGDLSRALLYYLYGGRSSYDHLNRIKRLLAEPRTRGGSAPAISAAVSEGHPSAPPEGNETSAGDGAVQQQGDLLVGVATSGTAIRAAKPAGDAFARNAIKDLSLPEWDRFVELVRQMLDAPLEVGRAPLLLRELGWAALDAGLSASDGVTDFARALATASPQGARFAVLALDYLCRAARLPREFSDVITGRLLNAQTKL